MAEIALSHLSRQCLAGRIGEKETLINKVHAWNIHLPHARGFIAQGSEFGFGKMYAHGINDAALVPGEDRFLQVVSCNTHNLAVLINTLGLSDEPPDNLVEGRFLCLRRSSDVSQERDFIPPPEA